MQIAGVTGSGDDNRLAVDVARERGIEITPFQRRSGERWGAYALRTGITRRETAKAWWEISQRLDTLCGLPRDPEPDWNRPEILSRWDPPWLAGAELAALRNGTLAGPVIAQRLSPAESLLAAIERLAPQLPPIPAGGLADRASTVNAALGALLPPAPVQLPHVAGASPYRGMTGAKVMKYLRQGAELAWKGTKVVLREYGDKAVPVYGQISTAVDCYNAIQWLREQGVHGKYLPEREYQLAGQQWIYRWPNGDRTAAPPP
ncbi:hypothetical protein ABZ383_06675 [Streptomyces sp. NPDC005900]|uniref:hypothetical protein n=1 Tax=Streptomyces sp. NPDC005900 TaxID=3154569 RepID=UPI0033DCA3A3